MRLNEHFARKHMTQALQGSVSNVGGTSEMK